MRFHQLRKGSVLGVPLKPARGHQVAESFNTLLDVVQVAGFRGFPLPLGLFGVLLIGFFYQLFRDAQNPL